MALYEFTGFSSNSKDVGDDVLFLCFNGECLVERPLVKFIVVHSLFILLLLIITVYYYSRFFSCCSLKRHISLQEYYSPFTSNPK
jgi:hypothetical protein